MTRHRAAILIVMIVSVGAPCVAVEIVLRALAPPPDTPGLFVPRRDELEYLGRPHSEGLLSGVPVRFNSLGLRDRDHPKEPDPSVIRIVALGDSMTFGNGVREPQTFPRVAEARLNLSAAHADRSVEFLNASMPGYNTINELALLRQIGLAFHPDVVVLGFLYNDVDLSPAQRARFENGPPRAPGRSSGAPPPPSTDPSPSLPVTSGGRLRSMVNSLLGGLRQRSLFIAWLIPRMAVQLRPLGVKGIGAASSINDHFADSNPDWQRIRSTLLEMKRLCDANRIRLVIMIIPTFTTFTDSAYPIEPYHKAVSDFCHSSSMACLDLRPAFRGINGTRLWISATDAHPNAEGHRIMGEALARYLEPALGSMAKVHGLALPAPGAAQPNDGTRGQHRTAPLRVR